jgi:6-phosphogluconolactonase
MEVFGSRQALEGAVADLFIDVGETAIAERGRFCVALAGGETPKGAYDLLAVEPRSTAIPWKDVFVFFGDERCVPPQDLRSNYKMAKDAFLDAVGIPPHNVHRIRGEIDPRTAAREYRKLLVDDLGDPPRFDLLLLGLGPDAHTASLFPGEDPYLDDSALVRATSEPQSGMFRVTLTPRAINAARIVAFAIAGTEKTTALKAVRHGPHDPTKFPAQAVAPTDGELYWLVDEPAVIGS